MNRPTETTGCNNTAPASSTTPAADLVTGIAISRNPAIFWGPAAGDYPLGPASFIADAIGNRRAYFLITPSWHRESQSGVASDREYVRAAQAKHPEHRFLFLAANRKELQNYREVGLPAVLCIHSAFIDETLFDIDATATKRFDAIYNAAIAPYKRHELGSAVRHLGLLYYRHEWFREHEAEHVNRIHALLSHATWINGLETTTGGSSSMRLRRGSIRHGCELCLSAEEGCMRASSRIPAVRLPVVSTPSVGGRDRLADPRYWIETEPKPEADSSFRRSTGVAPHRSASHSTHGPCRSCSRPRPLVNLIATIFTEEGVPFPRDADWLQLFAAAPGRTRSRR